MMKTQKKLAAKIQQSRKTSAQGTLIRMHRSMRSIDFTPSIILSIMLLPLLFDFILYANLSSITLFWANIMNFWISRINPHGHLSYMDISLLGQTLFIPVPEVPLAAPSHSAVWINLIACILIMVITDFLPKKYLPAIYLLRAALVIQFSASIYFFIHPDKVPYDMSNYLYGVMALGFYLLFLISPLLALIYYIFDFAFFNKLVTTLMIIMYFIIALPFQFLLHSLIIGISPLFMPVMYLLFGLLLDVLMFVALYSWAMTFKTNEDIAAQAVK